MLWKVLAFLAAVMKGADTTQRATLQRLLEWHPAGTKRGDHPTLQLFWNAAKGVPDHPPPLPTPAQLEQQAMGAAQQRLAAE